MTDDTDRSALLATKLRLLVARRWPDADERAESRFPDGAVISEVDGNRCWVYAEGAVEHRLGAALAVALRAGCRELHVVVEDPAQAGVLARRAACFADPPRVWLADGAELHAATASAPAVDHPPPPDAELYRPVLEAAGLDPVVEGGHLIGELLGLEVARMVVGLDGQAHVEAGVGRFDREVAAMMFSHLGETDSLARAVDLVSRYRSAGAERHPIKHLVEERWLRTVVVGEPSVVGAAALRSVGSAIPRPDLKSDGVASAVGVDPNGQRVVVVCSTGVYLDLVPSAADERLTHAPVDRLVVALPPRDAVPLTRELNGLLASPAEIVVVPDDWRSIDGTSA